MHSLCLRLKNVRFFMMIIDIALGNLLIIYRNYWNRSRPCIILDYFLPRIVLVILGTITDRKYCVTSIDTISTVMIGIEVDLVLFWNHFFHELYLSYLMHLMLVNGNGPIMPILKKKIRFYP